MGLAKAGRQGEGVESRVEGSRVAGLRPKLRVLHVMEKRASDTISVRSRPQEDQLK